MTPDHLLHLSNQGVAIDCRDGEEWVRLGSFDYDEDTLAADLQKLLVTVPGDTAFCVVLPTSELARHHIAKSVADGQSARAELQNADIPVEDSALIAWTQVDDASEIIVAGSDTIAQVVSFIGDNGLKMHSFAALPGGAWNDEFAFFGPGPVGVPAALAPVGPYALKSDVGPVLGALTPPDGAGAPVVRLDTGAENPQAPAVAAPDAQTNHAGPAPAADKGPAQTGPRGTATATKPPPSSPPRHERPGFVGGKPRFLGLILTLLLLLFLFAMGAWAATAGRDTIAGWFGAQDKNSAEPQVSEATSVPFDPDQPLVATDTLAQPMGSTELQPLIDTAPDLSALRQDLETFATARPSTPMAPPPSLGEIDISTAALTHLPSVDAQPLAAPSTQMAVPTGLADITLDIPVAPGSVATPATPKVPQIGPSPTATPSFPFEEMSGQPFDAPVFNAVTQSARPTLDLPQEPDRPRSLGPLQTIRLMSPEQRYVVTGVWIFPPAAPRPVAAAASGTFNWSVLGPGPTAQLPLHADQAGLTLEPLPRHGVAAQPTTTTPYRPQIVVTGRLATDTQPALTNAPTTSADLAPADTGTELAPMQVAVRPAFRGGEPDPIAVIAPQGRPDPAQPDQLETPGQPTGPSDLAELTSPALPLASDPAPDAPADPDIDRAFSDALPDVDLPPDVDVAEAPIPADDGAQDAATLDYVVVRPNLRPLEEFETAQRALFGGLTLSEMRNMRPATRPADIVRDARAAAARQQAAAEAQAAANAQAAAARTAAAAPQSDAVETALTQAIRVSPLAVAQASRPTLRPAGLSRQPAPGASGSGTVARASETVSPTGPVSRAVANAATEENQLRLGRIALMGVAGTQGNRRALIRLPNGVIERVRVGDRLDGGRVAAIDSTQLRYVKGGRNITLRLP